MAGPLAAVMAVAATVATDAGALPIPAFFALAPILAFAAMEVGHVVVVVLVGRVQHHGKIAHIQARLHHPADLHGEALHVQTVERPAHDFLAGAGIQQRRRGHIAADARRAL